MSPVSCKSDRAKSKVRPSCAPGLWLFVSLLLALAGGAPARAADSPAGPATTLGAGSQFTIADLDGDTLPDFASIHPGQNTVGTTTYSIELHLAAGRQSIQVAGPAGGLIIEARDVNGDRVADLLIFTAWLRQPVAILLNDGHGNFSQVAPNVFPEAFSESKTNCGTASHQAVDVVGLPAQSKSGVGAATKALPHLGWHAESVPVLRAGFLLAFFLTSHAGRAPPFVVHRS